MVLWIAAILEMVTGLAFAVAPSEVTKLLIGHDVTDMATIPTRVAGLAMLGLTLAAMPANTGNRRAIAGMLCFSGLFAAYMAYLGYRGDWVGQALWPVAAVHGLLAILLFVAFLKPARPQRA